MSETINLKYEWQCPHCGHNNAGYAPLTGSFGQMAMQVDYCDVETGGCDKQVAIQPRAQVSTTVYQLVEANAAP